MKTIIIIILIIYKYIQADNLIPPPPLYFQHKYGGYLNNEQQQYLQKPNTFLVRSPLHSTNFGPEYAEGSIQQQMPSPHNKDISIQTPALTGNSGSADDMENGIERNRIGAFLDRMSSRNSPIGFERQQAPTITTSHNWEEAEKQLSPLNSRGRTNTPANIGETWGTMTTSGNNRRNNFLNKFNKIIIIFLIILLILIN